MKSLVVFYSRTGNTRIVAEALVGALGADIEAIVSDTQGKGMSQLVLQTLLRTRARIAPPKNDASLYDLVVVGTPVWARNMSGPVRTYLEQNKNKFKSVAFFCTYGGSGSEKALKTMEKLCGSPAAGKLDILEGDVKSTEYAADVKRFAAKILESQH
ncbi:MAG: flavodoxin [Halobacteriota archaeon]